MGHKPERRLRHGRGGEQCPYGNRECRQRPLPAGGPSYSANGQPNPLDRAFVAASQFLRWFKLPSPYSGNNCGTVGLTCQVNISNGNLLLSISLPSAGTANPPVRFFYNSLANISSEYGSGWTEIYRQQIQGANSLGFLSNIKNLAGKQWLLTRDSSGKLTRITDPFNRRTTFAYDGSNKISTITDSGNRQTSFKVNASANLIRVSPPGAITTLVYDANHLIKAWINPLLDRTSFSYDVTRRITRITTPLSEITTFAYPSTTSRTEPIVWPICERVFSRFDTACFSVSRSSDALGNVTIPAYEKID